jgi:hypothetical protein
MQSDVWGTISPDGSISHTGGNLRKVLLQLMAGYVISYGRKLQVIQSRIIVISIWFNFLRSSLHLGI